MREKIIERLRNSWLFPRYIGIVYIEPVLHEASQYIEGIMLDIGCGQRRYEPIFSDNASKYVGLDWPQLALPAQPDIVGDALNIPLGNDSVDNVMAIELMEHLPSPDVFLEEVARILKKDGVFILSVPLMEPLHEEPRDYFRFTPYSLKLLLEKYGFSFKDIRQKGGWWSVVLGSFTNQVIYNWASKPDQTGRRRYGFFAILALPLCGFLQWIGYQLDRLFLSEKYTLGYTIVATRNDDERDRA